MSESTILDASEDGFCARTSVAFVRHACQNRSIRVAQHGRGPPISDQKYDPFLEAINRTISDFGGAGMAGAGWGWLGLGWGWAGPRFLAIGLILL